MRVAFANAFGLLVCAGLGTAVGHWAERPAARTAAPARAVAESRPSAAVLALLAPFEPGATIDGWTVRRISGVERGAVHVLMARGDDAIELSVVLASDAGPTPAALAGRYAVYYSIRHSTTLAADSGVRLASALARVLSNNAKLPPPGLTPFQFDSRR